MSGALGESRAPRIVGETTLVLLVVLAYLWLFRLYGFDLVDEGTQLAQIDRVALGERPYLDFETGYTPGYFFLQVALWRTTGLDLVATRTFGIVLHSATIALVYGVARRWFGASIALCLGAFDLAFLLPVSLRSGAPLNTPYPGWIVAPLALLAQILVAGAATRREQATTADLHDAGSTARPSESALLLGAGFASGLAFSVKPNAGLFVLGGAALALLPSWSVEDRLAQSVGRLICASALGATLLLLGSAALDPGYAVGLVLPLALAVARSAPSRLVSAAAPARARPFSDLALLAAGFLVPVLVWLVPLVRELGVARFARDVLLLQGGGVLAAYLLSFPLPSPAVVALCAGLLVAACAIVFAPRSDALARSARAVVGAAFFLGIAGTIALGGAPEPRLTAEQACLWLGPLALLVGLVSLERGSGSARERALLAFAAVFSLQLFPRPDLIHVAMGAPPVLLAAGAVWRRLGDRFAALASARGAAARWLPRVVTGVVLSLCVGRLLPTLRGRLTEPIVPLDAGARVHLVIAARHAAEWTWLADAVHGLTARTARGEPVFYFPDLAGLGFLAERPSPFYYLYFVPGRPDRDGERLTLEQLDRFQPKLAAVGASRVPAFAGAHAYFTEIVRYLGERYRETSHLDGCTLLERNVRS